MITRATRKERARRSHFSAPDIKRTHRQASHRRDKWKSRNIHLPHPRRRSGKRVCVFQGMGSRTQIHTTYLARQLIRIYLRRAGHLWTHSPSSTVCTHHERRQRAEKRKGRDIGRDSQSHTRFISTRRQHMKPPHGVCRLSSDLTYCCRFPDAATHYSSGEQWG